MSSLIYAFQGGFATCGVTLRLKGSTKPTTFDFCPSSLVEPQLNLVEGKRAGRSLVKEGLSSLAPREEPLF